MDKLEYFPIPKIVHLSYKSEEEILPMWKEVLPAWKKTNPTWEIKFWSDEENERLIQEEFPWFYETYKNFNYNIQRADAVRCCYLYKYGGLYIDMDHLPIEKIDTIFYNNENKNDNQIYLTMSSNVPRFTNSFMASKPGCKFWIDYLREISNTKTKWYWTNFFEVMNTTGPMQLDKLVKKTNITIGYINPNLIQPCDMCNVTDKCSSIYLKKIQGQTWNLVDSKIVNFLFCNKKFTIILIILILYIIFYFSSKDYICKYSCKKNK